MIASTMRDDFPLTVRMLLEHGRSVYGSSRCITWQDGNARRASYAQVAENAERLAAGLSRLGIEAGDRVATFCWNHQEHLEAYYAVPCMGAVLHTLNIRLPADQLVHIVNHAQDKVVIIDASLLGTLSPLFDRLPSVQACIVVGEADPALLAAAPVPVQRYDEVLAAEEPGYAWPDVDERAPASMCYTSGTTGDPKGVVYSHRSIALHALAVNTAAGTGASEADRILTFVPMFHVNAWGMPYATFLSGADLHLPGANLAPESICGFIASERPTIALGVPTIWASVLGYGERQPIDLSSLRMAISGGAAIPRSLMEALEKTHGLRVVQGWGMTETSPVGGIAHPPAGTAPGSSEDLAWRMKSGRLIPGVRMRIVADDGSELPRDGEAVGEIEVTGPWVTGGYHATDAPEKFRDGWLRTGDIGTLDERGYFRITDRSKDVIKSGGEWISSVDLENLLTASPELLEAAVIAIPDEKWTERPLAAVVRRPGSDVTPLDLVRFLDGKIARWQIPENWTFLEEVPKTSVGKFDKKVIRARFARGDLDVVRTRD